VIPSSQFGSTCGDSEYETKAHTVTVSADVKATEKMKVFGSVTYSDVTAKITEFTPATFVTADTVINALYDIDNLALYPEYSALHYRQGDVKLGCSYSFTPALYTTAQLGYQVFGDIWTSSSNTHPYGDQTGEVWSGALGVGYKF